MYNFEASALVFLLIRSDFIIFLMAMDMEGAEIMIMAIVMGILVDSTIRIIFTRD